MEKRKARFAKFDRPVKSSRTTRLSISQTEAERKAEKKAKATAKKKVKQQNPSSSKAQPSPPRSKRMTRRSSTVLDEQIVTPIENPKKRVDAPLPKPSPKASLKVSFNEQTASKSKRRASHDPTALSPKAKKMRRFSLDPKIRVTFQETTEEFVDLTLKDEEKEEDKSEVESKTTNGHHVEDQPNLTSSNHSNAADQTAPSPANAPQLRKVPSPGRRNRRVSSAPVLSESRVVFPLEVKLSAIARIEEGGKTQTQVAGDLQCPVSTIASWWHRREALKAKMAQLNRKREPLLMNGVTKLTSSEVVSKSTAVVPYQKNDLLEAMKKALGRKPIHVH